MNAKISHFADNFLGGSHDFKFGVQYNQGGGDYTNGYNDYIYTYGGVPLYGYTQLPFKQNGQMKNIGVFFDDTYRLGDRLTLNLGLRYDHSKASLPDAPVLDAEGNATSTIIPGIDNVFTWNVVSPRIGFSWKLNKSGHSVLKGHYGRYYRGVITGEFDDAAASVSARYLFSGSYDAAGNPIDAELVSDTTQQEGRLQLQEPLHRPVHRAVRAGAGEGPGVVRGLRLQDKASATAAGTTWAVSTTTVGYVDDQGADAIGPHHPRVPAPERSGRTVLPAHEPERDVLAATTAAP